MDDGRGASSGGRDLVATRGADLPATTRRDARLARAGRAGAGRSLVVSTLAFGHLPWSLPALADPLFTAIYGAGLGVPGTLGVGNGVLLVIGGLLAAGAARAVAPAVRRATLQSRDEGRASAAGASLTLAAVLTTMILGTHAYVLAVTGSPWLWLGTMRLVVAALTVGVFGGILFREVDRASGHETTGLPAMYQGLAAAAVPVVLGHFLIGLMGMSPFGPAGVGLLALGALVGRRAVRRGARSSRLALEASDGDAATAALPETETRS